MRAIEVERLIEPDHPARAIWELVGRLDLSRYYAEIAAVEGRAGRDHTDPQVLISLWLYAHSRGHQFGARGGAAVRIRAGLSVAVRVGADQSPHALGFSLRSSAQSLCVSDSAVLYLKNIHMLLMPD
ncbi:MAG: hypothetical protein ABSG32_29095 [Terriglobia bacterium]|jgi:hypothetical protein